MSEQENEHNRSIEDFGLDRIVRPAQEVRFTEIEIEEVDTISEAKAESVPHTVLRAERVTWRLVFYTAAQQRSPESYPQVLKYIVIPLSCR